MVSPSSTTPDPSSEEEGRLRRADNLHLVSLQAGVTPQLAPLLFRGGAGGGERP
ncbi:hypothetical protein M2346_000830 [Sphingobium xanthum]|nr:hypothetical protein [Sphingobium sp. B10D3B]MCW2400810.1 hypothetical protein [Sphingobium sp. B10D7B]MCW2407789.1 hypothetical protein [Sphingobium xanthum]